MIDDFNYKPAVLSAMREVSGFTYQYVFGEHFDHARHTADVFTNRLVEITGYVWCPTETRIENKRLWLLGIVGSYNEVYVMGNREVKHNLYILTDGDKLYYAPAGYTVLWVDAKTFEEMTK